MVSSHSNSSHNRSSPTNVGKDDDSPEMTDLVAEFEKYRLELQKFSTSTDGKERRELKKKLLEKRDRLYNDVSIIQKTTEKQRKGSMAPQYIMTDQQQNEACWDVGDEGAEAALWKSLGYKNKQKRAWSLSF
mmetsp:Transcript_7659/g.11712  ORF Transcript_7659/g.11712 Transcript_7659/m.11712 type:complete len:132 (+) Transcript_7659:92-487(+)